MINITRLALCMSAGYFAGSINPASLLGKIKKVDLKNCGTLNPGATNVMLMLGKAYGALVLLIDMAKAFFAVKLAGLICPGISFAGILSGFFAILGHVFPFYMRFKGGKGLAAFAGMVLALDWSLFLFLLSISVSLMLLTNYSVAIPLSAGLLFPALSILEDHGKAYLIIAFLSGAVIITKHSPNLIRAIRGEDIRVREYIKSSFKKGQ